MVQCPACGNANADGDTKCVHCGGAIPLPAPAPAAPDGYQAPRPSGGTLFVLATVGFVVVVILAVWGFFAALGFRGELDESGLVVRTWLWWAAGTLFWVSMLCALTGAIVRALWFLPGAEQK